MSSVGFSDSIKVRELESKVNRLEAKLKETETIPEAKKIETTDAVKTGVAVKGAIPATISTIKGLGFGGLASGGVTVAGILTYGAVTNGFQGEQGLGLVLGGSVATVAAFGVGAAAGAIVPHITKNYGKGAIIGAIGGGIAGAAGVGLYAKNLGAVGIGFVIGAAAGALGSDVGIFANK
jgi:hypothetical protein